jgi:hypothetical protein
MMIQELWPPTALLCGHLNGDSFSNDWNLTLRCGKGTVAEVEAAWWGDPTGYCGAFRQGNCSRDISAAVKRLCVGRTACTVAASTRTFGNSSCRPAGILGSGFGLRMGETTVIHVHCLCL